MWPRICEIGLGIWLIASPWIFYEGDASLWFFDRDIFTGAVVIALALLSWWKPVSWAHFFTGGVALWLGFSAWHFVERPGPPAAQNEITVAILLLMFFLLPNQASQPPEGWRHAIEEYERDISRRA